MVPGLSQREVRVVQLQRQAILREAAEHSALVAAGVVTP
jgi:hypothetical protein